MAQRVLNCFYMSIFTGSMNLMSEVSGHRVVGFCVLDLPVAWGSMDLLFYVPNAAGPDAKPSMRC